MRQLSLDSKPLTETSSTAPRRVPAFMRALSVVAVCLMLVLMAARASAQDIQYTGNSADLALRSDLKINPSTQGLELQVPMASYPGRAGVNLPVTLYYSSKVWRIKYEYSFPTQYWVGFMARYSENSSAGWTSSLRVPWLDESSRIEYYDKAGVPTTNTAEECYFIDRIVVRMPDGSSNELRSGDDPIRYTGGGETLPDELHAVDSSRLRYKRSTKELFMPDGSRYIFQTNGYPQYIDRNGNKLTSTSAGWVDTLGRTIPAPPLSDQVGNYDYSLPGVGGAPVTYTFKWRELDDAGVLSPGQQISWISNRTCNNPDLVSPPFLFEINPSTYDCILHNVPHNPVVLHQIVLPHDPGDLDPPTYTFNYNAYGEIDKVTYPTGAYERYVHQMVDWLSLLNEPYLRANRGVISRYVSATGSAADEVLWHYGLGVTVAPDGTRIERLMHREVNGGSTFGYSPNGARVGKPYEEQVYSAAGQMIRRKLTEWVVSGSTGSSLWATRNARVVKEVEILLDTGGSALAATTTYEYDADFNVTATRRYGYVPVDQGTAQTAPITSFTTPPTPLRTDEATYLVNDPAIDATTRAAYRARQLLSLPTSTRVKDGSGTIIAKTAVSYDETAYPLLTYPATPAIPNWTNPQTNIRGMGTTASAWVNTTNTWVTTHTQYDQCGSPRKMWDAKGNLSEVSYESTNNVYKYAYPTSTISPDPDGDGGSATPLTTSTVYDPTTGRVTSQTDPNHHVTTTEYAAADALGNPNPLQRLTKVNRPDGGWTAYGYSDEPDDLFVLTRTALDASRYTEARQYFDGLGRGWRSMLLEGETSVYADTQYDDMGRLSKVSNPYRTGQTAVWTTTTYDALGRALTVKTPDNAQMTTSYSGNQVTVTDQAGKDRRSVTDSLGRLTQVVEDPGTGGLGYVTDYTYDVLGNLKTVTQSGQVDGQAVTQTRSFFYDSLSRLTSAINPESGTIQYKYDANGNLVLKIDPRSGGTSLLDCSIPYSGTKIATCYEYDALNRVTSRDYNVTTTPDVTYTYDTLVNGKGRLTSVSSSASTTSYAGYDVMGRVTGSTQTTDGQPYTFLDYSYDLAGNLISQTYPSGRVVTSAYDDAGRLSQVSGQKAGEDDTTYASSFSYAPHGAVSDVKLGNTLWEHTNFNYRLQPVQIGLGTVKDGVNRLKLNYSYGTTTNNGNVLTQTITVPTVGTVPGYTATQSYTYDTLNRLKDAKEVNGISESWKQTFVYDRYGNRTFDTANTMNGYVSSNLTVNPTNNQYDLNQGLIHYDAAGNLDKDFGGHSFGYDAENRQVSYDGGATIAGGASYGYDGDGRRVKKVTGGTTLKTTVFVYNAMGQLVAEYDDDGQQGPGGTSYLTADGLGTPRVITNSSGGVKARHDYLPFGEEIGQIGGRTEDQKYIVDNVRQKFTQKERDGETGLDYFGARYYSSAQGRFTSVDPENYQAMQDLSDPQSWNAYTYVNNNPLGRVDPDGRGWLRKFWNWLVYDVWGEEAAVQAEEDKRRNILLQQEREHGGSLIIQNRYGQWIRVHPATMNRMHVFMWSNRLFEIWDNGGGDQLLTPEQMAGVIDAAPNSVTQYEAYKRDLRERMAKPQVNDPELEGIMSEAYRENAKVGSGSTAAAIREEARTGKPVGGAWHAQKGQDLINRLDRWFRTHPNASASDRHAAEQVILDLKDALGK